MSLTHRYLRIPDPSHRDPVQKDPLMVTFAVSNVELANFPRPSTGILPEWVLVTYFHDLAPARTVPGPQT